MELSCKHTMQIQYGLRSANHIIYESMQRQVGRIIILASAEINFSLDALFKVIWQSTLINSEYRK